MKSIKELVKRKEKLYFEVNHKDTKEFLRYLKHYTVKWSDGSVIDINEEFDSHRKILIGIEYKDMPVYTDRTDASAESSCSSA